MTASPIKDIFEAHRNLLAFDKSLGLSLGLYKKQDQILGGVLSTKYSILKSPNLKPVFSLNPFQEQEKFFYKTQLLKEVGSLIEKSHLGKDDQLISDLISAAATTLNLFIQSNFTGPGNNIDIYKTTVNIDSDKQVEFDRECISYLSVDGEPAYTLTSHPHLLLISLTILKTLVEADSLKESSLIPFAKWWLVRSYIIQQSLIDNLSSTLHGDIFEHFNKKSLKTILDISDTDNENDESISKSPLSRYLQIVFYLELARVELIYNYDTRAEHSLKLAQQKSHLQFAITGYKAKRTKYQQHETSQLVFLAKSETDKDFQNDNDDSFDSLPPPIALELNSDLLLEKIKYTTQDKSLAEFDDYANLPESLRNLDPNSQPALQDADSALILLRIAYIKSTSPYDNVLTQRELQVIANRIIESPEGSVNWCLYSRSLWERSLQEASSAKTVERGTLQMQSLVDELGQNSSTFVTHSKDQVENLPERLSYIHQLVPLPKWAMDTKLAERYMMLGALKSALEIFERLEMWHQVGLCYAAVGQDKKAEEVLTNYLDKNPKDARAWSILGDITGKPEYWEKSWNIGKYAGSRRSLGGFYYSPPKSSGVARDVELSIKYLNDALQVNPLHFNTWFLYGCAGLETEQYTLAAEAFTRCVVIDEEDGKSWSNLSTALLKLGKRAEAFNALKRALRLASEAKNWRIWENYITIAMELGDWNQVLRGTRELLNIDGGKVESSLDVSVLEQLADILVKTEYPKEEEEETSDDKSEDLINKNASSKLDFFQRSALELFLQTLPPIITNNARLWKLVAKIELWRRKPWAALEAYEKGFRIFTHNPLIESDESVWNDAVEFCGDLVDAYVNLGPREGRHGAGNVVCSNWQFKARSSVRVLTGKGKKWWEDTPGWEKLQEIKDSI